MPGAPSGCGCVVPLSMGMQGARLVACLHVSSRPIDHCGLLPWLRRFKPGEEIDIGMRVVLVHGDEVISDSETAGSFQKACAAFKAWVREQYFKGA